VIIQTLYSLTGSWLAKLRMLSCLIVLSCLVALGRSSSLESQWVNYKQSFSKEYATEAEESRRFAIWAANLDMVETHNQEAAAGVHSYTMAVNQFSDLSYEEFEKTMLGYQDDEAVDSFQYFQEKETPEAIDYRDEGLVTEVKNQGHCGSCWAFSATGGIEGVWAKQVNELISVSEQQLLDCGPGSCQGGNMGKAWNTAADGIMREEDYKYEHEVKECRYDENKAVSYVTGHKSVSHDEEQLELALAEIGYPISIGMRASATFQHYSNGVYDDLECVNDGKANHAILIVGYHKTNPDNMYWIVKNSWGHKWGKDGYIKMRMGHNICDMANHASYPTLDI